jgi:hypothetical protein
VCVRVCLCDVCLCGVRMNACVACCVRGLWWGVVRCGVCDVARGVVWCVVWVVCVVCVMQVACVACMACGVCGV